MDNEQILQLVDELFHEFASSYRSEARRRAIEKLTAHNKQSVPCDRCGQPIPILKGNFVVNKPF